MSREGRADGVEPLTEREQEVLELLAQGKTNRELADALVLSINTIKWHNRQIYSKLNVNNREQAAKRAYQLGLIEQEEARSLPDNNLSAAAAELVGRQAELAEIDGLVVSADVRLLTITGVGGVGKTRLAWGVAARQLEKRPGLFTDGVYVLSLSSLDEPEQLPAAIANVMNFPLDDLTRKSRPAWHQLADHLEAKKILLVLDNFEHLLEGATGVGELVRRTANMQLLITSRERLRLRAEHVFPLQGFTGGGWRETGTIMEAPFVKLFLRRAQRICPDFELMPEELGALARLQKITRGLPLAVELAASWVEILPLEAIVAEIQQDIDFLRTNLRDMPARQQSIRAVFEASWRRLGPALQVAFSQLSLFRGGFTRHAAEDVAGASLGDLATLSAKSLVQYDEEQDRYQIHELLRQFGERKLQEEPEVEQAARQRHAAYFCHYLHEHEQSWFGEEADEVLEAVERERANVRLAWRWAAAQGQVSLMAVALDSLCIYYERRGYKDEARELLWMASDTLVSGLAEKDDHSRRRLLIRLLSWRSHFVPSIAEGLALLQRAEILLEGLQEQEVGVRREEAFFSLCRGNVEQLVDPLASRPHFEWSLALYRELGDRAGRARAMTGMAGAEWQLGHYSTAADLVRCSLEVHKELGNQSSIARALEWLGLVEKHRGRLAEAEQAHRESWSLYRALGDRIGEATLAGTLASTLSWSGDFAGARAVALDGLKLVEEMGSPSGTAYVANYLAYGSIHLGRYKEAQRYGERAIRLARESGFRQTLGWALMVSGQVSLAAAAYRKAVTHLEEAASVLAEFRKSTWFLPLISQALALEKMDHLSEAYRVLIQALRENESARVPHVAVNALPVAALLLAGHGNTRRAVELYALAQRSPFVANSHWFEDVVGAEIDSMAADLSAESVEAARSRHQTLDLWETAGEVLRELERVDQ
jgi:predicted ATPase/DNA-binding CsgD family transcriptional regulator